MIFTAPPQLGQCSMSMSKTRLSSRAQAQLRRGVSPCTWASSLEVSGARSLLGRSDTNTCDLDSSRSPPARRRSWVPTRDARPETRNGVGLSPAEDLVEGLGVALEIFQHFGGCEGRLDPFDQARLLRRRIDSVGNAVHTADKLLAAL